MQSVNTLRFDPAQPLTHTPPFVRWTLEHSCSLRALSNVEDPDQTDRLLRSIRCFSDARHERRVVAGVALAMRTNEAESEVLGFRVRDVLEPFGGEAAIVEACTGCPANALARVEAEALAGCVGYLILGDAEGLPENVTHAIRSGPWPHTNPAWHALWLEERLDAAGLAAQRKVLSKLLETGGEPLGLADYLAAIDVALEHQLPLIARLHPAGRCEGRNWYVAAHCGRCKASWPEQRRQQCRVCGIVGGRQTEQRKRRMGTRPYRRLSEFLTPQEIEQVLASRGEKTA
jgi:hypothetical protein